MASSIHRVASRVGRLAVYLSIALFFWIGTHSAGLAQATQINPDKTRILFEIDAIGWPRTRGVFRTFEGSITVNLQEPSRSNVSFTVQAGSVDTGSSSVSGFVKSASMLNVAAHPTIRFRSRQVVRTGASAVRVTGDLTFMGTTGPATFLVDVDQARAGGKLLGFTAKGTIKRSEFGFISGQPLISDDVLITVTTEAAVE